MVILFRLIIIVLNYIDIFLPTSGLTGAQDWLFVMKNNQCCVGASLLWIMDPIRCITGNVDNSIFKNINIK